MSWTETWISPIPIGAAASAGCPSPFSYRNGFNATLDGNGHTISGLYINRSNAFASPGATGLFGYVGSDASIFDITLDDIEIAARYGVGALAGSNQGTIENSHSSGVITDGYDAAGLVGINQGVIKNSSSSVEVMGNSHVGGLVGRNRRGGEITGSHATGAVSSSSPWRVHWQSVRRP